MKEEFEEISMEFAEEIGFVFPNNFHSKSYNVVLPRKTIDNLIKMKDTAYKNKWEKAWELSYDERIDACAGKIAKAICKLNPYG